MTVEKILEVVQKYERRLNGVGYVPVRHPMAMRCGGMTDAFNHLGYMCGEIRKFVTSGRMDKAMCWLGFMQGVWWAYEYSTLAELADDNRPKEETSDDKSTGTKST